MTIIHKTVAERDGMDFVLSDETVDRYGDIIEAKGWEPPNLQAKPDRSLGSRQPQRHRDLGERPRRGQAPCRAAQVRREGHQRPDRRTDQPRRSGHPPRGVCGVRAERGGADRQGAALRPPAVQEKRIAGDQPRGGSGQSRSPRPREVAAYLRRNTGTGVWRASREAPRPVCNRQASRHLLIGPGALPRGPQAEAESSQNDHSFRTHR